MATPLSALYRLTIPYTVSGLAHVSHAYLSVVASGDSTGYNVIDRTGANSVGLSDAVDKWWENQKALWSVADTTVGTVVLEQRSGFAWNPLTTHTPTVTLTGATAHYPAEQATITLRDTAFHKVRVIALEQLDSPGQKISTVLGGGAALDAWLGGLALPGAGLSADPYYWLRGRSNLYVGSFISYVTDLNDKLRRARGTA